MQGKAPFLLKRRQEWGGGEVGVLIKRDGEGNERERERETERETDRDKHRERHR